MKAIVVAPTRREAAALPGAVLVCGSGARAAAVVDAYLRRVSVDLVIVAGVCGGLDPSLRAGDLILARRVIVPRGAERRPDAPLLELARRTLRAGGCHFVCSSLLSLERPAGAVTERTDLWNTHGAAGVDMETYDAIGAAEAHGRRWLALRAVLDPAGRDLPAPLLDWREEAGERDLLRRLATRPGDWFSVARLALAMARAHSALAHSLPSVVRAAASLVDLDAPSPSRLAIHK